MPLLALSLFFISCEKAIDTGPHVTVIYDGLNAATTASSFIIPDTSLTYTYHIQYRVINNGFCKINEVDLRFTCFFMGGQPQVFTREVYDLIGTEYVTFEVTSDYQLEQPIQQEVFIQPQCGCETR